MKSLNLNRCPRCGDHAFECLGTHSYCVGCNYSPDEAARDDHYVPRWALDALRERITRAPIPLKLAIAG